MTSHAVIAPLGFAVALALAGPAAFADPRTLLDDVPASLRLGPGGQPLTAEQTIRLLDGKTLSGLLEGQGHAESSVVVAIVDATPTDVYKTLRDYPHFHEYMPHVSSATVDSHAGNVWLVSVKVHGALGLGDREYQLRIVDEKRKVAGKEVLVSRFEFTGKGNIKASKGAWTLVPLSAGTKTFATYSDNLDPGGAIPHDLKSHMVLNGLEDAMEAVQKHSGARH